MRFDPLSALRKPLFLQFTPFELPIVFFAAEDEGRTEEPTEHKLRKAREEGKVAKSVELTSALVLLFAIAALGLLASGFLRNAVDMLKFFFQNIADIDVTRDFRLLPLFLRFFMRLALPIMVVAFFAALLGNIIQVGFLFTVKPLIPDFSKIVPRFGRFFKRAFFSGEAAFNLGKSIFKVIVIVVLAYLNIRAEIAKITNLMTVPFMVSFTFITSIAFRIIVEATIAMLVIAIFDYVFQRRQHLESLKMSRQELKEERRMYEGDPLVRSRLRERMREIMSRSMIRAVPEADVVITNPTHYSVALEYDRVVNPAPLVVAKGVDSLALKIREIAEEHGVPIVENRPLARALYSEVEVGDTIPEKYFEVMAVVIAEAWRVSGKAAEAG